MNQNKIVSYIYVIIFLLGMAFVTACGGGGSSSSGGSTGTSDGAGSSDDTSTTGTASTASLNTVPNTDISNLDFSTQSSGSSSLTKNALYLKADNTYYNGGTKFLGEDLAGTGSPSRAGCEYNMMKKEIKREGVMISQAKCAADAMAAAGLIEMPSAGESITYLIDPPEVEDHTQFCDDIPPEFVEELERCLSGEGPGGPGGTILMTIARTADDVLQLDVCEDSTKIMEGEYSANGTIYTIDVRSIFTGFFEAEGQDKMRFSGTIDIGTEGTVANSIATIGTDGTATITMRHVGSFGSGRMVFTANGATKENEVEAYWSGNFTDPFSGTTNTFEDKVYALVGQTTGCAKYAFSGDLPPESIDNLVPLDISTDNLGDFLSSLSSEIGIQLTVANYQSTFVCMNPDFDWDNPDPTEKPMLPLQSGETSCPDVTHTDVECFSITNVSLETDFGTTIKQIFTIVDNSNATQFETVNAFDLSTIATDIETPAYSRGSDCDTTGATTVAFESLTPTQGQIFQTNIERCFEYSEDSRGEGMEDHNCGDQVMKEATNDFAEGGPPDWCYAGGDHLLTAGQPSTCPTLFFNDCISDANSNGNGDYCMPSFEGCTSYSLTNGSANGLSLPINTEQSGAATVTALNFTGGTTSCASMTATYLITSTGLSSTCEYTCSQPTFDAPPDETGFDHVEGAEAGEGGFLPPACIDAGITDPSVCEGYCLAVDCGAP